MTMRLNLAAFLLALPLLVASSSGWASYAFYVGKNLSDDQGVLIAGAGEEVSSHWLEIVAAADHDRDATVTVGVTDTASIPGERIDIAQATHTFRYLSMSYSNFEGFPAPLTNGGINEHQVAVRDVWAPNRQDLIAMTPRPQTGPQYSDLARLVLERAASARAGAELIGRLIARHGYATYGGNTHLIADPVEAWVVWEFAGGQRLWAAERLGPDAVRVLYPGAIGDFPLDYSDHPDYMGSANLVRFARQQGWFRPEDGRTFNLREVYGPQRDDKQPGGPKYMTVSELEQATRAMAPVSEQDLMARVRDHRIADDEAGYGQVASLKAGVDPDLVRIWAAPTTALAAPFNPWWLGVRDVPPEYAQHRYLTRGAAASFLNPAYARQEASVFAGRRFKQVLYYMCADPEAYRPLVTPLLQGFEVRSRDDLGWVEAAAQTLIAADQRERARDLLTFYAHTRADAAMTLADTLIASLKTRSELLARKTDAPRGSINASDGETVNCLVGADPDKPKNAQ